MKGISFQSGIEIRVEIQGEKWSPGDTLLGTLTLSNRSSKPVELSAVRLDLSRGLERKLKKDAATAFDVGVSVRPQLPGVLEAGASTGELAWTYQLAHDTAVSDVSGSLFVVYGLGALTTLRLKIEPIEAIREMMLSLSAAFKFKLNHTYSSKQGYTEFVLSPPDGREFGFVNQLCLFTRSDETDIHLRFEFDVQVVDGASPGLKTKVVTKKFERTVMWVDLLHRFNGKLNKDAFESLFQEVLKEFSDRTTQGAMGE